MKQQETSIIQQFKGLWRFKWIIILAALIAGGTAFGFTSRKPVVYEATATLTVPNASSNMNLPAGFTMPLSQDLQSQIDLITTSTVLDRAVTQLDPEKAADAQYVSLQAGSLGRALRVHQLDADTVAITVSSTDPLVAQKQANAVAEASVYEINAAKTSGIQSELDKVSTQMRGLGQTQIDVSTSPDLAPLVSQMNDALQNLEAASGRLDQIASTDNATLQGSQVQQSVDALISDVGNFLSLAGQPSITSDELAVIESQTRALAVRIQTVSQQVDGMWKAEPDPQIYAELLDVDEQLQTANTVEAAVLTQVISLSAAPSGQDATTLQQRIVENGNVVLSSLNAASSGLKEVATLRSAQLQNLDENVKSAVLTLKDISGKFAQSSAGQPLPLSYSELAALQTQARSLSSGLTSVVSTAQGIHLGDVAPDVYADVLAAEDLCTAANGTVQQIPAEISAMSTGAGGNLSYNTLSQLQEQLQLALLADESGSPMVASNASVSSAAGGFSRYKSAILAGLAVLLLAIFAALLLQYFDRRIRDTAGVVQLGLPILASVALANGAGSHSPSVLNGGGHRFLEDFRMLRANLALDSGQKQVILVTSPAANEGKTTVASNLARVLSLEGRRVLLIDADVREPGVASVFGLGPRTGLREALADAKGDGLEDYVASVDGVDVITSGIEPGSMDVVSLPRVKGLLEKAKERYDTVIIDSAEVLTDADTRVLARAVDAALVVLLSNRSGLDVAKESVVALQETGVRVAGLILNGVRSKEK